MVPVACKIAPLDTQYCLQNGELSTLEEYFNEEDPLDYTPEYKDIVIQRNLYSDAQSGMPFTHLRSLHVYLCLVSDMFLPV